MIPKFRAWDKRRNRMIEVTSINFRDGNIQEETRYAVNRELYLDQIKLMQYTGIKDRNGMEIYEGDIVSVQNGEYIKPIIFSQGAFFAEDLFPYEIPYDCKVIGNLYENPELLEEAE